MGSWDCCCECWGGIAVLETTGGKGAGGIEVRTDTGGGGFGGLAGSGGS